MKMSESHGDDPVEKVGAVSTNCSVVTRSMTGSTPGNRTKSIGGVGKNAGSDVPASVPGHRIDQLETETGGIAPLPSWSESEGEKNDSLIPVEASVAGELTEEDCLLCDVDVTEYLKELRELEKKVDRSDLADGTMTSTTLSKSHSKRRFKSEESFLSHLAKVCEFIHVTVKYVNCCC